MKTKLTTLGLLASLGAASSLLAQSVTAPVGYRTESVDPGVFNLLSSNFSNAVAVGGAVEAATATTLTATGAFADLVAGTAYTVKITAGAGAGNTAAVTAFTADELTVDADLGAAADDLFQVRATPTISQVFGDNAANGDVKITTGTAAAADIVWIPTGGGNFVRRYHNGTDWKNAASFFGTFNDEAIPATAGIFIESRAAAAYDVVFVGHVETSGTSIALEPSGFNFLSRVLPVEISLLESGLSSMLESGAAATADIVWIPTGNGGYDRRYWNGTNWKNAASFFGTFDDDVLASGYLVQNQSGNPTTAATVIPSRLDI